MVTALCDEYPRLLRRHREIFVAVLLLGVYICALPTTTYVSYLLTLSCYRNKIQKFSSPAVRTMLKQKDKTILVLDFLEE